MRVLGLQYRVMNMPKKNGRVGLVHVYTGNGKGKTTTALGLALRALGHGYKVYMIQLLKGGNHMGEVIASKTLLEGFTVKQFGKACPYSEEMSKGTIECGNCRDCFLTRKEEKEKALEAVDHAEKIVRSGKYDVVIIDEINNALHRRLVPLDRVVKLVKGRKKKTELILTGRNAPKGIIEVADYVTRLDEVKHPFNKAMRVRRGIDY
ncbi:cob(I)yrinic acid a,c-diamide adenosyltransferase [Candidatus Altiarchaeota archaeon]